jgi:hypothetical protein
MNAHSIDRSDQRITLEDRTTALRQITAEQLLHLGTLQVSYLNGVTHEGERVFVLYGADGVPLAVVDTVESATETAAELRLELITVH